MEAFQVLSVLLLTAAATDAQSFHIGKCPQPPVQEDFDVAKYMGIWYEIERLPAIHEKGKCIQANYTLLSDGTVSIRNAELLPNGKVNSIQGTAKVKDPSQPAILGISFFKGVSDAPYWVLSTDYQTYSLVYACSDYYGVFHFDFAWILARTRVLAEEVISQLHDKMAVVNVDLNQLIVANQTDCDGHSL
ncbi:apolipoprotein D-like [Mugil cephalus]|uniref:apolipoprotein D-like n=1 Tax=Mugil cephalus TaxID=48193 RepID=UPI001FB6B97D|nr:apolipoprotein D-like [Mugil cephalus]